ncbi:hypothetical protein EDC01DRAFT_634135 [Geopyxis carbonaria]|nr:hypothetical protein EDC01DRAFT_634135 [Geopyxis carbonaria]
MANHLSKLETSTVGSHIIALMKSETNSQPILRGAAKFPKAICCTETSHTAERGSTTTWRTATPALSSTSPAVRPVSLRTPSDTMIRMDAELAVKFQEIYDRDNKTSLKSKGEEPCDACLKESNPKPTIRCIDRRHRLLRLGNLQPSKAKDETCLVIPLIASGQCQAGGPPLRVDSITQDCVGSHTKEAPLMLHTRLGQLRKDIEFERRRQRQLLEGWQTLTSHINSIRQLLVMRSDAAEQQL